MHIFSGKPRYFLSFTLLELLIVIAILAILASVTFIALNPAEQLKKARDSRRLADLRSLDKAVSIYESQALNPVTGSSTKVYLSLPDTSATCASYSLPPAPPGYTYSCVTEASLRKTNSTGWVPIDFTSIAIGSPLASLPTDPKNDSTYYYTYVTGGSFMVSGLAESSGNKISDQAISDGGRMPGTFEFGSDLNLGPFTRDNGLVGDWTFDEGTGTTAYDYSGNSNTGTLTNGPTWQTSTNCKKGGCLSFDGVNDYVNVTENNSLDSGTNNFSILFWLNLNSSQNTTNPAPLYKGGWGGTTQPGYNFYYTPSDGFLRLRTKYSDLSSEIISAYNLSSMLDQWIFIGAVINRSEKQYLYISGILRDSDSVSSYSSVSLSSDINLYLGVRVAAGDAMKGYMDDVRIYNRALSAPEIQAVYNATR